MSIFDVPFNELQLIPVTSKFPCEMSDRPLDLLPPRSNAAVAPELPLFGAKFHSVALICGKV